MAFQPRGFDPAQVTDDPTKFGPTVTVRDDDVRALEAVVQSEIGFWANSMTPAEYQAAVANVVDTVLNRVASSAFKADTIQEVIDQDAQFSAINPPGKKGPTSWRDYPASRVSEATRNAVRGVLSNRAAGVPSSVGPGQMYADPPLSSARSRAAWVDALDRNPAVEAGFGPRNRHVYGKLPGQPNVQVRVELKTSLVPSTPNFSKQAYQAPAETEEVATRADGERSGPVDVAASGIAPSSDASGPVDLAQAHMAPGITPASQPTQVAANEPLAPPAPAPATPSPTPAAPAPQPTQVAEDALGSDEDRAAVMSARQALHAVNPNAAIDSIMASIPKAVAAIPGASFAISMGMAKMPTRAEIARAVQAYQAGQITRAQVVAGMVDKGLPAKMAEQIVSEAEKAGDAGTVVMPTANPRRGEEAPPAQPPAPAPASVPAPASPPSRPSTPPVSPALNLAEAIGLTAPAANSLPAAIPSLPDRAPTLPQAVPSLPTRAPVTQAVPSLPTRAPAPPSVPASILSLPSRNPAFAAPAPPLPDRAPAPPSPPVSPALTVADALRSAARGVSSLPAVPSPAPPAIGIEIMTPEQMAREFAERGFTVPNVPGFETPVPDEAIELPEISVTPQPLELTIPATNPPAAPAALANALDIMALSVPDAPVFSELDPNVTSVAKTSYATPPADIRPDTAFAPNAFSRPASPVSLPSTLPSFSIPAAMPETFTFGLGIPSTQPVSFSTPSFSHTPTLAANSLALAGIPVSEISVSPVSTPNTAYSGPVDLTKGQLPSITSIAAPAFSGLPSNMSLAPGYGPNMSVPGSPLSLPSLSLAEPVGPPSYSTPAPENYSRANAPALSTLPGLASTAAAVNSIAQAPAPSAPAQAPASPAAMGAVNALSGLAATAQGLAALAPPAPSLPAPSPFRSSTPLPSIAPPSRAPSVATSPQATAAAAQAAASRAAAAQAPSQAQAPAAPGPGVGVSTGGFGFGPGQTVGSVFGDAFGFGTSFGAPSNVGIGYGGIAGVATGGGGLGGIGGGGSTANAGGSSWGGMSAGDVFGDAFGIGGGLSDAFGGIF